MYLHVIIFWNVYNVGEIKSNKDFNYLSLPNNPSNENELKDACDKLQQDILLAIIGNNDTFKANYVASFGNLLNSQNITDWVEIANSIDLNVINFFWKSFCNNSTNLYILLGNKSCLIT